MLLNKEALTGQEKNNEPKVAKIETETKVHDPELVKKQIQDIVKQLNEEIGQEVYKVSGERKVDDAYGIGTVLIFLQYLGRNLSPLEICISANKDGLVKGINPDPETVKILIQASTIQLKAGLSKHGELIEKNGNY